MALRNEIINNSESRKIVMARRDYQLIVRDFDMALQESKVYQNLAAPKTSFSIQCKAVGGNKDATFVIDLMLSLNGEDFETTLTYNSAELSSGKILFQGTNLSPSLYFKAKCRELTLNTSTHVECYVLGVD